jgi:hypothetical protein
MMRGIFTKRTKSKDSGDENHNDSFSNNSELPSAEAPVSRGSRGWGRRSKGGKGGTQEEASAGTSTNSLSRSQQQLQVSDSQRRVEEDQPAASKPLGGMSAEEKFMAYYQQKQNQKVTAPAPAPPPSGDHLAMAEEEERQRDVLKEQQQQQALAHQRALEQQQAQQLARQQQARQEQEAMRQQQAQKLALQQQQAAQAVDSQKEREQSDLPEDGMSVEDARKERARQAVEDRKRKAREAVEARKAKARQAALDKAGGNNGASDDGAAQQAKARAEQERRETELANQKAEEDRLEKQRYQEEARLAREAEAERMAQEQALVAERARQEAEVRKAEQARMEQQARAAHMAQQEAEARLQEESRQREQARIAHEQKLEQRRKQEEAQWQEEQRLMAIEAEKRKADEARLAVERFADQQRQAEEAEASRRQQEESEAVAQAGREALAELQRLEAEEAAELELLEAEEAAAAASPGNDDDSYNGGRASLVLSETQEEAVSDPRSLLPTKSEDVALDGELSALLDESALFDAVLDGDVTASPAPLETKKTGGFFGKFSPKTKVTKPKKEESKKVGGLRFYRPKSGTGTSSSRDSEDPRPLVSETPSPKEKSVPARTPLTTPRKLNSQLEAGATTPIRKYVVTGSPAKFSNGRHKRSTKSPRNQPVSPARSYASTGSSVEIDHLPRSPLRPVPLEESEGPVCDNEYISKLHQTRGPCSVCLYYLSDTERAEHDKNGRHYRVNYTFGGCLDCQVFPNDEGEEPVRLCKKCFFDTHKQHKRKEAAFESSNALAGIGSRSPK